MNLFRFVNNSKKGESDVGIDFTSPLFVVFVFPLQLIVTVNAMVLFLLW